MNYLFFFISSFSLYTIGGTIYGQSNLYAFLERMICESVCTISALLSPFYRSYCQLSSWFLVHAWCINKSVSLRRRQRYRSVKRPRFRNKRSRQIWRKATTRLPVPRVRGNLWTNLDDLREATRIAIHRSRAQSIVPVFFCCYEIVETRTSIRTTFVLTLQ